MKRVREYINEKFEPESDPIKDLQIGVNTFENIKKGDVLICKKSRKFRNISEGEMCLVTEAKNIYANKLTLYLIVFSQPSYSVIQHYRKQLFGDAPPVLYRGGVYKGSIYNAPLVSWKKSFEILQPKDIKMLESVNEKFQEKSDPIEDMNIGGVDFEKEYFERYKEEENKLYWAWQKFVMQFKGKWVIGIMDRYEKGIYKPQRVQTKVFVHDITMNKDGLINLETDFATYHLLPGQRYKIKDA